jgi:hypothetical protein
MRFARLLVLVLILVGRSAALPAQGFSIGGSLAYATLDGSDYDGIDAGLGFDAQVRYQLAKAVSIGGGFQYTSHGVGGQTEDFHVRGFFADARYAFSPASTPKVMPYLGARFAATHWTVSFAGSEGSANGTAIGPVGGLLIRMGSATQLDVGVAYLALHFGDGKLDGVTQPNSSTSGSTLAMRFGFLVGFGKP